MGVKCIIDDRLEIFTEYEERPSDFGQDDSNPNGVNSNECLCFISVYFKSNVLQSLGNKDLVQLSSIGPQ